MTTEMMANIPALCIVVDISGSMKELGKYQCAMNLVCCLQQQAVSCSMLAYNRVLIATWGEDVHIHELTLSQPPPPSQCQGRANAQALLDSLIHLREQGVHHIIFLTDGCQDLEGMKRIKQQLGAMNFHAAVVAIGEDVSSSRKIGLRNLSTFEEVLDTRCFFAIWEWFANSEENRTLPTSLREAVQLVGHR